MDYIHKYTYLYIQQITVSCTERLSNRQVLNNTGQGALPHLVVSLNSCENGRQVSMDDSTCSVMQSHTRIKKKKLKKTKKSTPEVPDVSNTGVFHGKTQMLSCSSSTCPSTGAPVQENFIITCSHHVLRVTNLGNISDAQLFPRCFGKLCQSCHLSDRLISGEQSPF